MEEIRNLLLGLEKEILSKRVSLNTRDGRRICSIPEEDEENPKAALDAANLGISEMRTSLPCVLIEGRHEKIVIAGAGPKMFISAEIMCEIPVTEKTKKLILKTAQKIAKRIK